MKPLSSLLRENVRDFVSYSSARSEFSGVATTHLDANENALGSPVEPLLNRYPDPYQRTARDKVAEIFGAETDQIILGNGSDEIIDLLIRAFVTPKSDEIWVTEPSYGMYKVSASLQEGIIKTVQLTENFDLPIDVCSLLFGSSAKLFFLCSPNNPTGNTLSRDRIGALLAHFPGIVVVDEAYIDFSSEPSLIQELSTVNNLVVLRTFSKAWGMAAARIGVGVMSSEMRSYLDNIKPPYNINELSNRALIAALDRVDWKVEAVSEIVSERESLEEKLHHLPLVEKVYPSEANFILFRVKNGPRVYEALRERGIIVRDRSDQFGCKDCLRVTVGTSEENLSLIEALQSIGGN